jgi:hypothetical protein
MLRRSWTSGTLNGEERTKMSDNPFAHLDISYEEIKEANTPKEAGRFDRDKRICICGHGLNRHKMNLRGRLECKPNTMYCKCKHERPVIEVEDTRLFILKTIGHAAGHALLRGMQRAYEKKHKITWLIDSRCDVCGVTLPTVPMIVNEDGSIASQDIDTGRYALMCRECRSGA